MTISHNMKTKLGFSAQKARPRLSMTAKKGFEFLELMKTPSLNSRINSELRASQNERFINTHESSDEFSSDEEHPVLS